MKWNLLHPKKLQRLSLRKLHVNRHAAKQKKRLDARLKKLQKNPEGEEEAE